jgi:Ca2+-transporting ATPase
MKSNRSAGHSTPAISFRAIRGAEPDRSYYVKTRLRNVKKFFTRALDELCHSMWETLSFDHISLASFTSAIWPAIASGAAFVAGEYATEYVKTQTGDDDYEYILKFLAGAALLGYAVSYRLTEEKPQTLAALSAATARETLAITYLYTSTFSASRDLFADYMTDSSSLIMSLGASAVAIPGLISYGIEKYQASAVKKAYAKGAQRSDTALFSSGQTPVVNIYLQANYFLLTELSSLSRQFQLGLISYNILNTQNVLQQFRNLPALIADAGPPIIKRLLAQREKIDKDFRHNTANQQVLRFIGDEPTFSRVPRYQLRTNDLVWCNEAFDISSVPVSGEMIALERNSKEAFLPAPVLQKFSVNLKSHNGEDVWIEYQANTSDTHFQHIDLHKIRDGKQAGVLTGTRLNLHGDRNFFIKVKPEAERSLHNHYEKTAVINQLIMQHKQRSVLQALGLSGLMACVLTQDPAEIPKQSLILIFNLFQMMIPFSETFLREMINNRLLRELNIRATDHPIESIDALRIVDLSAALDGYYQERFPRGVAIVSDKTGTLTTSRMDVLGFWTAEMPADIQTQLLTRQSPFYNEKKLDDCFDVFVEAYTHNKKELEPEEHAIRTFFESQYKTENSITVDTRGSNHFIKSVMTPDKQSVIETWHLGLYRQLGGRFTLADRNGKKYLIFCGVPRADIFHDTQLLQSYASMQSRTGVLSRDWCLGRTELTKALFTTLHDAFIADDKTTMESALTQLLSKLMHQCTFLIDNPVKKAANKFIPDCQRIHVPVFIATGDTVKAAENIAKVLAPDSVQKIIIARQQTEQQDVSGLDDLAQDSTVIFAGVNTKLLALFDQLMTRGREQQPVIIFAEMSTEDKGTLTRHLKEKGYFVVANGDGSNDVAMMKNANVVIAHKTEDGNYAPGVGQLANLDDVQLQQLMNSSDSFYELFDISNSNSAFRNKFIHLANSQEKPSFALMLKSCKISFELAKTVGLPNVEEMWQQHWFSVGFDLVWLGIAFHEILASKNLPFDNKNLLASSFVRYTQMITLAFAAIQSLMTYSLSGKSTNVDSMILMLCTLPLVLKSIFSAYSYLQDDAYKILSQKNMFVKAIEPAEVKNDIAENRCNRSQRTSR